MSKARKAKTLQGPSGGTVITVRQPRSTDPETGAPAKEFKCWEFRLVDQTAFAKQAVTGNPINGSIRRDRVAVSAAFGLLGFAPDGKATEIKAAAKSGGRLAGVVIATETATLGPGIKLCFYEN